MLKLNSYVATRYLKISKSSCPEVFYNKGVLEIFTKFTGKHLRQSFFFNKVANQSVHKLSAGIPKEDENDLIKKRQEAKQQQQSRAENE